MVKVVESPHDVEAASTRHVRRSAESSIVERVPTLTLLAHAQANRIGERATLLGLAAGEAVSISRLAPKLDQPGGRTPRPLADPFLSREAYVSIEGRDGELVVRRERGGQSVRVDGTELVEPRSLGAQALENGVVIELEDRCVLLLHSTLAVQGRKPPTFDLVGESDAIRRLRRDLERVAATEMRVLIRGETGTGKELAARAIHRASARAAGPYEAVNMGAIQPSLSASALFGHVRGAFSGAVADHEGHFAAADGGTLFLDEISDTDPGVQAMLLRTLETSEIVRVGDRRARTIDVRLLSATDADLEEAVASGRFREPLLHRLGELTLRVPPLRERRDDIGRLVVHFLRELLDASEQERLLDGEIAERPWLAADVVAQIARAPWTGNVRQLRNVVRQLVVHGRDEPTLSLTPELEALFGDAAKKRNEAALEPAQTSASSSAVGREVRGATKAKRPQDLTEDEISSALEKTGFRRGAAADLLGIARSSLYALIANNKRIARSQDLTRADVESALAKHGGDLRVCAAELSISEHGLKLRMQTLGLLAKS